MDKQIEFYGSDKRKTKKFELWLGESGDFKSDGDISKNSSLVDGVLIEKGGISETVVKNILGSDYVLF